MAGCQSIGAGEVFRLSLQDVSVVRVLSSKYAQKCMGNYLKRLWRNGNRKEPALAFGSEPSGPGGYKRGFYREGKTTFTVTIPRCASGCAIAERAEHCQLICGIHCENTFALLPKNS